MPTIKHVFTSPVADGTVTSYVRPSDWNSEHAFTGLEAIAFYGPNNSLVGSVTSGTVQINAGDNITFSQVQQSITISGGLPLIYSYENIPAFSLASMTFGIGATSAAVSFLIENALEVDYLRIPAVMTMNSTTAATTANTNASMSFLSTWNAVFYTRGTSTNNTRLESVTSAQALYTYLHSVSILSSTRQSHSQYYSYNNAGTSATFSTSYTVNTNSVRFSSQSLSDFSGVRFIDIPITATLNPNGYWLMLNVSTSSASNATGLSNATTALPRYSNVFGVTQINSNIGILGQANLTSGGYFGAGSVTTSNTTTQSVLPLSVISSTASHQRLYFQMYGAP